MHSLRLFQCLRAHDGRAPYTLLIDNHETCSFCQNSFFLGWGCVGVIFTYIMTLMSFGARYVAQRATFKLRLFKQMCVHLGARQSFLHQQQ